MDHQQRERQRYLAAVNFGQAMLYMRLYLGISENDMIGAFHQNLKLIDKRHVDMSENNKRNFNETKP